MLDVAVIGSGAALKWPEGKYSGNESNFVDRLFAFFNFILDNNKINIIIIMICLIFSIIRHSILLFERDFAFQKNLHT